MDSHIGRDVERLSGGLDRPTLVVAGVATLGLIMAVLDTTIVNVALDAPLGTIQWVSTGYLLSLAAVIPLSGWITERFGSKRTWIASIALFAIGSALCALAASAAELIAFRVLQGFGGGMLIPVGFKLVAQSAGPRRVGRALALVGVPILLGPRRRARRRGRPTVERCACAARPLGGLRPPVPGVLEPAGDRARRGGDADPRRCRPPAGHPPRAPPAALAGLCRRRGDEPVRGTTAPDVVRTVSVRRTTSSPWWVSIGGMPIAAGSGSR
jgi:hypothetical protein